MTTPPLDLTQNDLDTIRLIADGGSRNDVMTIKNTSVLALLNRVEAGESARDHWEEVARGALARAEAAEATIVRVRATTSGWWDLSPFRKQIDRALDGGV